MSNIKYGLISQTDARTLEATIGLICENFKYGATDAVINITEIGVYAGQTMNGMRKYIRSEGRDAYFIGIDNMRDGEGLRSEYDKLIIGNSNEVYNQIEDNSQHLIIVDGLHTFAGVVSDFFCYAPKVKVGGFIAFHDTGKHIDPLSGWQGVGFENDPDFCLGGVRKALESIGLFEYEKEGVVHWVGYDEWGENENRRIKNWDLVFDEADLNDEAGGFTVFQKLY